MIKVLVGHSRNHQSSTAVREVIEQLYPSLDGLSPQAGILFCAEDFNHGLILSVIQKNFPGIQVIGCTTNGEFSSLYGFTENSLTFMVFVTYTAEIGAGVGKKVSLLCGKAGRLAAISSRLRLKHHLYQQRFAITFSPPLPDGIKGIEGGIREILGQTFPIFGAVQTAHPKGKHNYQFFNGEVLTDSVVLLLFAGAVSFSRGVSAVSFQGKTKAEDFFQQENVDKTAVIPSCTDSIRQALAQYPGFRPAAALFFSGSERKILLGNQIIREAETARYQLGNIPFCGFYPYCQFGAAEINGGDERTPFVTLLLGPNNLRDV